MKKKLLFLSMLLTISITACGKQKDTGVLINANTNENVVDSSKNEVVTADTVVNNTIDNINDNDKIINNITTEDTTVKVSEMDKNIVILGNWVLNQTKIYTFYKDGNYILYDLETGMNIKGTYQTDMETYLNINQPAKIEYELQLDENELPILDEDGNEIFTEKQIDEINTNYKIEDYIIDNDNVQIKLSMNGTEYYMIRSDNQGNSFNNINEYDEMPMDEVSDE